ncbi:hypothetical protein Mkiyose1088_24160 [Mycobacterium kiyosense]|uniref:Uncharacterized protein n=1 Tax=Mycobacterium kiyosense TaxID=2871094 RepID=A0A9P3QCM8_9MYCO|nr:hypothetical protein MKCMC460_34130 [Mycobacterium sp. 20KCMC460]GLB92608.1 hypothetical protein SRL2020130_54250 [Mycobacterium kiyosense]GLC10810.1 hypothetical protein SRL2020411_54560 [Mycobacterium kiyosense]GLC16755.1 hypothetical protein SRL2020448_53580 [Mycobacterium kiyosense]GLC23002.1 hypothetical protein SRL2020472_55730 [Mycobacterium kiyosense]
MFTGTPGQQILMSRWLAAGVPRRGTRRYEVLRAYFIEDVSAAEIADRFGYSTAPVHQRAPCYRPAGVRLFVSSGAHRGADRSHIRIDLWWTFSRARDA